MEHEQNVMDSIEVELAPVSRAASPEPSPPRRSSMEDADSSLKRKRPRLDTGSRAARSTRSMSAEVLPSSSSSQDCPQGSRPAQPESENALSPQSKQPPSQMTINVRGQLPPPAACGNNPSSPELGLDAMTTTPTATRVDSMADSDSDGPEDTVGACVNESAANSVVASPDSPALEIEVGEPEDMDDDPDRSVILLEEDDDEFYVENIIRSFPYGDRFGSTVDAALQVGSRLKTDDDFDHDLYGQLSLWLKQCLALKHPSEWRIAFQQETKLWEAVGTMFRHLLRRSEIYENEVSEEVLEDFLQSYAGIVARLMQIDASILENTSHEISNQPYMLSHKHVQMLAQFTNGEASNQTNFYKLLRIRLTVDCHQILSNFARYFITAPRDGLHHASQLCALALQQSQTWPALGNLGVDALRLIEHVCNISALSGEDVYISSELFDLFPKLDQELLENSALGADVRKEVLSISPNLLEIACEISSDRIAELISEYVGPLNEVPLLADRIHSKDFMDSVPYLIGRAWKFRRLWRYISKGRMELRVLGIDTMNDDLVHLWVQVQGERRSVIPWFSHFLLQEKITDYIVGVDSHPQVISRGGNVIGFLIVSETYKRSHTDAIWRTITMGQDPRVVAATLRMLSHLVSLMPLQDILYLFCKLHEARLATFNWDMINLMREAQKKLALHSSDWRRLPATDEAMMAHNLCIRLIQETTPSAESTKFTLDLHREATDMLNNLTFLGLDSPTRQIIYEKCLGDIKAKTPRSAGSMKAIFVLSNSFRTQDGDKGEKDLDMLTTQLSVTRFAILELCGWVEEHAGEPPVWFLSEAMICRLEFLGYLVDSRPESVPDELYGPLWDHLVGKSAINDDLRDTAWRELSKFATQRRNAPSAFLNRLIRDYLSKLEPTFFTSCLFDFVNSVVDYEVRITSEFPRSDDGVVQFPIMEVVWRVILEAPADAIAHSAAQLLTDFYLSISKLKRIEFDDMELAHIALVDRCIDQMATSYFSLNPLDHSGQHDADVSMDTALSDAEARVQELRFTRTLLFLKQLLRIVQTKPEFASSPKRNSKAASLAIAAVLGDSADPDSTSLRGDPLTIRYQAFNGAGSDIKPMTIGTLDTFKTLHGRLHALTGFKDFFVLSGGKRIWLLEQPEELVHESSIPNALLIVKKTHRSNDDDDRKSFSPRCSAIEREIVKHFDRLYNFMDSEDALCRATFDLLCLLPPHSKIASAVSSDSASLHLFPPEMPYKSLYTVWCLRRCLNDRIRMSAVDGTFILHGVQLLEGALVDNKVITDTLSQSRDLLLAPHVVECFLSLLKERFREISSSYFADPVLLVDRLVSILQAALGLSYQHQLAIHSFASILEASVHSRDVWDAFTNRSDLAEIHLKLLLLDSREKLRQDIANCIETNCRDTTGDSAVDNRTTNNIRFFWRILSQILPDTVNHSDQSRELFNLAHHIFTQNNELVQEETLLRAYLTSWSTLLVEFKHEEIVGRDEIDEVVWGFTKLILYLLTYLKSFKKPIRAGFLVETIFQRFLFAPPSEDAGIDWSVEPSMMPILDRDTRKALYDLVLALCEDAESCEKVIGLVADVICLDQEDSRQEYNNDAYSENRSISGYVGLSNLRATCYMNSLLAQFFMNLRFREFMLNAEVSGVGEGQELLRQTQHLFASMQNSYERFAATTAFVKTVKDAEGLPINPNIQMDADEFFSLLFDQWEKQMISPEERLQFGSFYGGQTVNQIKSKECQHVSERIEPFSTVACEVKGKGTLLESLQSFVEGDVMEGENKYRCESCGGKLVDAVKRTCLKDVPDNLIFHLKRFDFDLGTLQRCKVNDYFEFPECIDVSQYKVDYLNNPEAPRQEDIFILVGVIIHSGTAEAGHYWSYIRERPSPMEGARWLQFNDTDVTEEDLQSVFACAFGRPLLDGKNTPIPNSTNAYMLFYQRKTALEAERAAYSFTKLSDIPRVLLPETIAAKISLDNQRHVRQHCLFDPHYMVFFRTLLNKYWNLKSSNCSETHECERLAITVAFWHLSRVLGRVKEPQELEHFILLLKYFIRNCPGCCRAALDCLKVDGEFFRNLMFFTTQALVRSKTRNLVAEALQELRRHDEKAYGIDTEKDPGLDSIDDTGLFPCIVERLSEAAHLYMHLNPKAWDEFYGLLSDLARFGTHDCAVLLRADFILYSLELLSIHVNDHLSSLHPELRRIMDRRRQPLNGLVSFLCFIFQALDLTAPLARDSNSRLQNYDDSTGRFPLLEIELSYLRAWDAHDQAFIPLAKMFDQYEPLKSTYFFPGFFLEYLLHAETHLGLLNGLTLMFREGIDSLTPVYAEPYVRGAICFCKACPSPEACTDIIAAMSRSTTQLDGQNGRLHLEFFYEVHRVKNHRVMEAKDESYFYLAILDRCFEWAVHLMCYDDSDVRTTTSRLLNELIFFHRPDTDTSALILRHRRCSAVRKLVEVFYNRLTTAYRSGWPRQFMDPMTNALHNCRIFLRRLSNSNEEELKQSVDQQYINLAERFEQEILPRWAYAEEDPSVSDAWEESVDGFQGDSEELSDAL